jgi:hypothetical protein
MQTPRPNAQAIKDSFRKAVVTRKKVDHAAVKARGTELLGFLRQQAKADLEALEEKFLSNSDIEAVIRQIEPPADAEQK